MKVPVEDILDGKEHDAWYPLDPIKEGDRVAGSLRIPLTFILTKDTIT